MIFTDYWKGLVLNFSVMGNTVFFWVKKLVERYLLVSEKFLFLSFRWWEIQFFFQPKYWWEDYIYIVFLSFLWYSGSWQIWFFAQCEFHALAFHPHPTLTTPLAGFTFRNHWRSVAELLYWNSQPVKAIGCFRRRTTSLILATLS